ncbi:MAG: hypothetical protein ACKO2G_01380 [Verrucomicrobiales bacterium]
MLLSFALHIAGFYLFRVVYPPNQKSLPRDAEVWQLRADDPDVLANLARHGPALGAFSGAVPFRDGPPAIDLVPMRLSFDGYQPGFERLPPRSLNQPLVFPNAVPAALPPTEELPMAGLPSPARDGQTLWEDPATGEQTEMPWTCPEPTLVTGESLWQARVTDSGQVAEAVPLRSTGGAADAALRRHLLNIIVPESIRPAPGAVRWLNLRFAPGPKS